MSSQLLGTSGDGRHVGYGGSGVVRSSLGVVGQSEKSEYDGLCGLRPGCTGPPWAEHCTPELDRGCVDTGAGKVHDLTRRCIGGQNWKQPHDRLIWVTK